MFGLHVLVCVAPIASIACHEAGGHEAIGEPGAPDANAYMATREGALTLCITEAACS